MHTNTDSTQNLLVEKITENIKLEMEAINEQLVAIDLYDKGSSNSELKERYDRIYEAIKSFEEYIKSTAFEIPGIDPNNSGEIKKQVYERFFSSSAPPDSIELLTYATMLDENQNTDYDLILACARRARQNGVTRLFVMCNLDFIESELLNKQVKIENVKNLGILHHYLPIKFDINQDQVPVFDPPLQNKNTEEIVTKVFEIIPKFIKENIKSPDLKVVLRSCSGAAPKLVSREDPYPALEISAETKSYPVKLLPPDTKINENNIRLTQVYPPEPKSRQKIAEAPRDANWYRNNEFKRARETKDIDKKENNICIRQDITGDEVETLLYLPFNNEGISLEDFPTLKTKEDFKLFAKKLIEFLGNYKEHPLHINHYNISLVIKETSYEVPGKKIITDGFRLFKKEFADAVKNWESKVELKEESKPKLKRLFTAANDLLDVVPLHEKSYAAQLLSTIKDDCPNVSVFKAYFGGYRAAPDRTIREVSKVDINNPKAIVVSRNTFWKQEQPKQESESLSENATPLDNSKPTT